MARPPKPWFWKKRQGWYVTIDGTRHFLAVERDVAVTRFHQLMAEPQKRVVSGSIRWSNWRADRVETIVEPLSGPCGGQNNKATLT